MPVLADLIEEEDIDMTKPQRFQKGGKVCFKRKDGEKKCFDFSKIRDRKPPKGKKLKMKKKKKEKEEEKGPRRVKVNGEERIVGMLGARFKEGGDVKGERRGPTTKGVKKAVGKLSDSDLRELKRTTDDRDLRKAALEEQLRRKKGRQNKRVFEDKSTGQRWIKKNGNFMRIQ